MMTFGDLVRRNGAHWPNKDAFVELDRRVTWGEVDRRTDAIGHGLRALGVQSGDRVAVLSNDCIEVAETFLACAKIGAIRVGVNARLAAAEIASIIKDCQPRILIYAGEHQRVVSLIQPDLDRLPLSPTLIGFAANHSASHDYDDLIARFPKTGRLEQSPAATVMIAYTSGSTGLPKGAIYPHDKFLRTILYTAMNEGLVHDTVWLQAMPAAGVPMMHMLRNIFLAATCVIVGPWNAERALTLITRERATNCVLVPTMLAALLTVDNIGKADVSSMKLLGYGASPLPPATIREAMRTFGCPFLQMYGTTELLGMTNMLFPSDHQRGLTSRPELLASIGRPLSYVDTRIVDEDDQDVAPGEIGELIVRSDVAFPGYWNAPEKTAEMFLGDWMRTGDLARADEEGYVYLSDRAKFRMKSGGYNVFPTEIENVLAEHAAVHEVSVFGVPDPVWGDRIEAVVSLKPQQSVDPEDLKAFCKDKIANFKIPKNIEIWADLPKGATGKILKRAIIETMTARTEAAGAEEEPG
ncbi:acyl-CoA synthetase (AMP-forming)/AMP-acid ligase II [Rhodoligotrophos appendicifer]|uniref:class I adenylate-forming enzyme family protein n=1 Tax=Rhodoligotrophos appendicifer TaxID=987056 RepID=UPI00118582D9|nr:AMP-binding protein [Rhodoligotrophos appendicifer]